MAFFEDYNKYKEKKNLADSFIKHIDALEVVSILGNIYFQSNHTFDRRESRAVVEATLNYPDNLGYIHEVLELEHGLFFEGLLNSEEYPEGIIDAEHYESLIEYNTSILKSDINEFKNELDKTEYDNYQRKIKFTFDFIGEMQDVDLLNEYTYYVYIKARVINIAAPYWSSLVVQALELEKEMKHELSLLLMFSAFDNFITLEIEKVNKLYFSEIELSNLEFGKKVSILLKHFLSVAPGINSENHPVRELILKMYDELYSLRNAVAHGKIREITKQDYEKCLDMLIFTYIAINFNPDDNVDLLRKIKKL